MSNFNNIFNHKKNEGGPREGDFRKRKSDKKQFGRNGGGKNRMEMHEAICSECGKRCEVPFKPTGDKPVYCSECFSNRGGGSNQNRNDRGGNRDRRRFRDRQMFDAICDKCGKKFELPFRPTGEKPVYCNDCFDRGGASAKPADNKPAVNYKEQFDMLNAKLDRLINVLINNASAKENKKEVVAEEVVVENKKVTTPEKKISNIKKEKKSKKTETKKAPAKKKKSKK